MLLNKYSKVQYSSLDGKAKEAYNFQKACAILAEYGFVVNLLKYDWLGADFLAQHIDGDWLKVQLKSRLYTNPKYEGKDIYMMYEDKNFAQWYFFPHDELTKFCKENYPDAVFTKEGFSTERPQEWVRTWLRKYAINPKIDSYVYQGEDSPKTSQLVNKAYQFANDVCATILEDGKVSFLGESYFRSFVLKVEGEILDHKDRV